MTSPEDNGFGGSAERVLLRVESLDALLELLAGDVAGLRARVVDERSLSVSVRVPFVGGLDALHHRLADRSLRIEADPPLCPVRAADNADIETSPAPLPDLRALRESTNARPAQQVERRSDSAVAVFGPGLDADRIGVTRARRLGASRTEYASSPWQDGEGRATAVAAAATGFAGHSGPFTGIAPQLKLLSADIGEGRLSDAAFVVGRLADRLAGGDGALAACWPWAFPPELAEGGAALLRPLEAAVERLLAAGALLVLPADWQAMRPGWEGLFQTGQILLTAPSDSPVGPGVLAVPALESLPPEMRGELACGAAAGAAALLLAARRAPACQAARCLLDSADRSGHLDCLAAMREWLTTTEDGEPRGAADV
jgi:hypothetical protein